MTSGDSHEYSGRVVDSKFLRENTTHVFVFGDNTLRRGKKGGAALRDEPNAYGFITKKRPCYQDDCYYKPAGYREVYKLEVERLRSRIESSPSKIFLVGKIGSGLANKFGIFEKVIEPNIKKDLDYPNVRFLW